MSDHYDRYNGMEELLSTNLASLGTDCISRQAAIDALGEEPPVWYDGEDEIAEQNQWKRDIEAIKQLPPIQPKRGRWEMGMGERFVECSECGLMTTRNELRGIAVFGKNEPNFCPNCGADMREVTA